MSTARPVVKRLPDHIQQERHPVFHERRPTTPTNEKQVQETCCRRNRMLAQAATIVSKGSLPQVTAFLEELTEFRLDFWVNCLPYTILPQEDGLGSVIETLRNREKELILSTDPDAKRYYAAVALNPLKGLSCSWPRFKEFWEHVVRDSQPTEVEMRYWLKDAIGSKWGIYDTSGKIFREGYYDYPDVDDLDVIALSREEHINALLALPYHRSLVQLAIEVGAHNRYECRDYAISVCQWFTNIAEELGLARPLKKPALMPIDTATAAKNNK